MTTFRQPAPKWVVQASNVPEELTGRLDVVVECRDQAIASSPSTDRLPPCPLRCGPSVDLEGVFVGHVVVPITEAFTKEVVDRSKVWSSLPALQPKYL